ncbi:MAG TPA: hypothetical protein VHS81_10415 [Caulobacteraceae bacterium]|nr:hypothetical protein [Caulobacteraceae bacterium]
MTLALVLAATLVMAAPPSDGGAGEPLPPGAPTDSYELAAWCYGALDEYLLIYEKVIPDLKAIDAKFGTDVKEAQPYHTDMAAYRVELKVIGDAVTAAEKASATPIADHGVASMNDGRHIWSVAEGKERRELARAWMMWALPDRCDGNARELTQRSALFGKALNYNQGAAPQDAPAPAPPPPPAPDATAAPPPAENPPAAPPPASGDVDQMLSRPAGGAPAGDNPAGYPAAKPN